jgi:hypothetical protein
MTCVLCAKGNPRKNMQDARQQALGHVMSTETKALLFASFIGGFTDCDKMAAIASDPVMTFQRCT